MEDNSNSEINENTEVKETNENSETIGNDNENEIIENKLKLKKKKKIPGIVYLSSIPTKMNVKLIRDYFSEFGTVDRIFLQPEEKKSNKKHVRMFSEGWVEFKDKKIAKLVAKKLNAKPVGGKRRNPWYEELWNIKYLKNFRWTHLNERLAYENETRKQRLRQEVTLAKKEANFYIQNVEKSEKRKRLEKKLKKTNGEETNDNETNNDNNSNNNNNENKKEDNNGDENFNNKRPKFERKVKVTNNENFLKLVFAK